MTTRRELITNLYNNFLDEVKEEIDNNELVTMFPSLENKDLAEIITFFNIAFGYVTEYEPAIRDLISLYGININEDELRKGMPIITKFINELKQIQK